MAGFEEDLKAFMLAADGVAAIVADRVVLRELPQRERLPALVIWPTGVRHQTTYGGRDNYSIRRVQFNCWARTPGEATLLGRAVLAATDGLTTGGFDHAEIVDDFAGPGLMADAPKAGGASTFHSQILIVRIGFTDL